MPAGGTIPPDGRPPQAKGIGKTARRHDLEAPATPGVGQSDMQQGDRKRLEAAQRVAPRPKKRNASGQTGAPPSKRRRSPQGSVETPDPIDMASSRPGKPFDSSAATAPGPLVNPEPWMPMIRQMAINPNSSGAISEAYVRLLTARRQRTIGPSVNVVDTGELDDILLEG